MNEESKQLKPIGRRIRHLRKQKGMNIRELAEKVGISRSYISQIELESVKSPTIETVIKITKALDVTISELVEDQRKTEEFGHSVYNFPLDKEEFESMREEKELPEEYLNLENLSDDTVETLKTIVEIFDDPEIPIQEVKNIQDKVVSYAEWLQQKAKDKIQANNTSK